MGKKLVMAQKRGETRALCLGAAMVVCAVIAYYILGTTVLPLYQRRYRTPRPAPSSSPAPPQQGSGVGGTPDFFLPFPLTPTPGREVWTILILGVKDSCAGRVGQTGPCWSGILGLVGNRHRRPSP